MPDGVTPGTVFVATLPGGGAVQVICPPGAEPGSTLRIVV